MGGVRRPLGAAPEEGRLLSMSEEEANTSGCGLSTLDRGEEG